jgi:hypothetical protein
MLARVLSSAGTHSVVLTWNASITPNVTYNVYRSTVSGMYSSPIAWFVTDLTYTDVVSAFGPDRYYYVVTAVDTDGESGYSDEALAIIPQFSAVTEGVPLTRLDDIDARAVVLPYLSGLPVQMDGV